MSETASPSGAQCRFFLAAIAVLSVLCGCSGMTRREKLVKLATTESEPRARISALDDLSELKELGVREEVESILEHDDNPAVRASAAAKLADMGDKASVGALLNAAKSDEDPVARTAALRAAVKLAGLGDDEVRRTLVDRLKDDHSPAVREQCASLIGRAGYTEGIPALVAALGDYDSAVKVAAHRSLVRMTGKKGLPPVRETWELEFAEKEQAPPAP